MALPLPVAIMAGMGVTAMAAIGVWSEARTARAVREHWEEVAAERGLHAGSSGGQPTLHGPVPGGLLTAEHVLRHTGSERKWFTRVVVEVQSPLPPGLELQRAILGGALVRPGRRRHLTGNKPVDRALAIYGPDTPMLAALAADPRLQDALAHAVHTGMLVQLREGRLQVDRVGRGQRDLRERLDAVLALAQALAHAAEAPWRDAAARFDLGLQRVDTRIRLQRSDAMGTLDVGTRLDEAELPTRVTLRFSEPLGPPFSVTGPGEGPWPGQLRLGDPVLDGMVRVSSRSPETTREILRRAEVRGALLAVVHPYPLSRVTESLVVLHLETLEPGELCARIGDVIELGAALTGRAAVDT